MKLSFSLFLVGFCLIGQSEIIEGYNQKDLDMFSRIIHFRSTTYAVVCDEVCEDYSEYTAITPGNVIQVSTENTLREPL